MDPERWNAGRLLLGSSWQVPVGLSTLALLFPVLVLQSAVESLPRSPLAGESGVVDSGHTTMQVQL